MWRLVRGLLGWVCALGLAACGASEGGGGGGDGGVVTLEDAMVDAAGPDMGVEPYETFCRARAEAICEWGFGCLDGEGALRVFGLSGATVEACAAAQVERCEADLGDRAARGTLELSVAGGEACAQRLAAAPCLPEAPSTWVAQWQAYVQNNCGSVARGLVRTGEACEVQADCATPADACVDGACGPIPPASLTTVCAAASEFGVPTRDTGCPTGTCVNFGHGATGICSAGCEGGRGCGGGGTCIVGTALGGAERRYCVRSCFREGDPLCEDFVCEPIGESDDRSCVPPME